MAVTGRRQGRHGLCMGNSFLSEITAQQKLKQSKLFTLFELLYLLLSTCILFANAAIVFLGV